MRVRFEHFLPSYLAAAGLHARLSRLELSCNIGSLLLVSAPGLASLPHLRQLELYAPETVGLALSMPQLEEATVQALSDEFGPIPPHLGQKSFEWEMAAEEGTDTAAHSNLLAAAAAPRLRRLDLTLGEAPSKVMAAGLATATGLTHLRILLEGGAPGGFAGAVEGGGARPPPPCLDCRLLPGMGRLQEPSLRAEGEPLGPALVDAVALSRPLALRTLALGGAGDLPPLAAHMPPGLRALQLSTTATALAEQPSCMDAMAGLTALRRLALGGAGEWVLGRRPRLPLGGATPRR
eukprot:scaffold6.g2511.t1